MKRLPAGRLRRYTIKEGSRGPMVAAFERVTLVRDRLPGPRAEIKYYLSNAPSTCAPSDLANLSGWRWPMETLLEEAKGEVGLDHYETRTWAGWHHHVACTALAHLFLVRLQLLLKKSHGPDRPTSPAPDRPGARSPRRPA
jgi:SRSO17 transposase